MFCMNCGKQIRDGSLFCPYCGQRTTVSTIEEFNVRMGYLT